MDVALAFGTAATLTFLIALGFGGDRPADALAYGFALGFGAILLIRRQAPRIVLSLSVLALFAYYSLDYPTIGVAVPVLAALFSAADRGAVGSAVGAACLVVAATFWFRYRAGEPVGFLLGYESVSNVALAAVAIVLGITVRGRRERTAQREEIDRLLEEQRHLEAVEVARSERERISRELHDTVGHALTVISMHASVGAEAVGRDDTAATNALTRIRETANGSLREVRALLKTLRTADDPRPQTLADAEALFDRVRAAGLTVEAGVRDLGRDLSPAVDRAIYRVLQESLTNTVRHARATRIEVMCELAGDQVHLRVADDGAGVGALAAADATSSETEAPVVPGRGIQGMRERVRILGGEFSARQIPQGFVVEATLPVRADA